MGEGREGEERRRGGGEGRGREGRREEERGEDGRRKRGAERRRIRNSGSSRLAVFHTELEVKD